MLEIKIDTTRYKLIRTAALVDVIRIINDTPADDQGSTD